MDITLVWHQIADAFVKNMIVEDRYMLILDGLLTTVLITVLASVIGTILGGLVCWMRMSSIRILSKIAKCYVDIMRGTPVLVLLMIMYYIALAPVVESAVLVAVITFSMNASAYICEMLRSGIEGIDKGQSEAGLSLGFNSRQAFFHIVLPQVVRNIMPVYHGELISLLKSTSIVGYIAIMDMTKASDLIRSRTFDAFFPLIIVAILYFVLAWLLGILLNAVAKRKPKRLIPALAVVAVVLGVAYGYGSAGQSDRDSSEQSAMSFRTIEDIADHGSVAVMEGSIYDIEYSKRFPKAVIHRVKNISEAAEFVLSGKATALIALDVQTKYVIRENPSMIEIDSLFSASMGAGFMKGSPLRRQFNDFLRELRQKSDYKDMIHRWIECDLDTVSMPDLSMPVNGEPVIMAITGTQTPMNVVRGDEYVGFDIELGMRFAKYINKPLKLEVTTFQGLIPDLTTGRVDMAVSDLIITPERAEEIDFSDIYYDSYASIVMLKTTYEGIVETEKHSYGIVIILLTMAAVYAVCSYRRKAVFRKKVDEYMNDNGENQNHPETGDVLIRISGLEKRFEQGLTVLNGIDAEVRKGEVISVIGPSGTGKSTFLRCLNLLGKPTGGSIMIGGKDILSPYADVPMLRRRMGMVFQSFNLFEGMSVLDNITLAPVRLLGRKRQEANGLAMELLRTVGLAEKANAFPSQLSGGQKQRIAIARALAMEPDILLFDEPTSALDPTMVSEVLGAIHQLAKRGMTMIVVTHEMRFAREVSNRVFFMAEGHIYEENSPDQLFDNPQKELTKVFINQIREFNYIIETDNYDYYGMMGSIIVFAEKYNMSHRAIRNLRLAVEESLTIMGAPVGTEIKASYSERTMELSVRIYVPKVIPESQFDTEGNSISSSIIRGISSRFDLSTSDGHTALTLTLNQ